MAGSTCDPFRVAIKIEGAIAHETGDRDPEAVGGAEQVLSALDHALVEAGHDSIVVSNSGSQVAGTLIPTGPVPADITEQERAR